MSGFTATEKGVGAKYQAAVRVRMADGGSHTQRKCTTSVLLYACVCTHELMTNLLPGFSSGSPPSCQVSTQHTDSGEEDRNFLLRFFMGVFWEGLAAVLPVFINTVFSMKKKKKKQPMNALVYRTTNQCFAPFLSLSKNQ